MSTTGDVRRPWSVGVVVPARNEQRRIKRCLESVLAAMDASGAQQAWIVVVADRCTDRTVPIARRVLRNRGLIIECAAGSPGTARRHGANAVLRQACQVPHSSLWFANTDADSYVPCDWISRQLQMATEGATAVAGIVNVDSFEGHGPEGARMFSRHYLINADGTHPHVHGANIGVRADVYLDIGGWSDTAVGEDHCLWQRVQRRGWPVLATSASVVTTSGRLRGRARGGFADTLRARLRARLSPPLSAEGSTS